MKAQLFMTDSSSIRKCLMTFTMVLPLIMITSGCGKEKKSDDETSVEEATEQVEEASMDNRVHVFTNLMDFNITDTITAGWQTFVYENRSDEPHFILIDKYPEGKGLKDAEEEVGPVFQEGMNLIMQGEMEKANEAFGKLPEWFQQVKFLGGTGLVSGKNTGISTVFLEPGDYLIECYVKMENGTFHSTMGMVAPFVVKNEQSGNPVPEPSVRIDLSSTDGIVVKDSITSGKQVFEVNYLDQIVHENFVGHDVNLARLDDGADIKALEAWMNWADPKGLISPAPASVTFLGGVNDMPAGSKGYFEVELTPGQYVLISEVPNTSSKNMLHTFTID